MSYVRYDESIYRTGHRMFGLTDPFTASHGLNGINHSYNGFGPWMLHGYPFSEKGGYTLQGLGGIVPDGSIVNYTGKWTPHGMQAAKDVIDQVAQQIADSGLIVRNLSSSPYRFLLDNSVDVKLQIQVSTGQGGFGDPNDIISIIRHAVYTVTGSMPLADSIPTVQAPSAPGPTGTGQPPGPGADPNFQPPPSSEDWGAWLQDNFGLLVGLAAALVIVPPLIKKVL